MCIGILLAKMLRAKLADTVMMLKIRTFLAKHLMVEHQKKQEGKSVHPSSFAYLHDFMLIKWEQN